MHCFDERGCCRDNRPNVVLQAGVYVGARLKTKVSSKIVSPNGVISINIHQFDLFGFVKLMVSYAFGNSEHLCLRMSVLTMVDKSMSA